MEVDVNGRALSFCFKGTMRRRCPLQAWKGVLGKIKVYLYGAFLIAGGKGGCTCCCSRTSFLLWRGRGRQLCANQTQARGKDLVQPHPRAGTGDMGVATINQFQPLLLSSWGQGDVSIGSAGLGAVS